MQQRLSIRFTGHAAWRWGLLVVALVGATPLAVADGGGATAITLRYRFITGQAFAYRLTGFWRQDTLVAGHAPSSETFAVDGVVSYRILDVSPAGVADAAARIESAVITNTVNGTSTVTRLPPALAALETPTRVHLGPDNSLPGRTSGTLVSNSYGDYGLQCLGALPAFAVVPGQHWPSSASSNLASGIDTAIPPLPHVRLVADNTLIGLRVDGDTPVAVLNSLSRIDYAVDTVRGGQPVHVQAIGTFRITSQFDLTQKRLHASVAAIDITYTVTAPQAAGGRFLARTHFIDDATLRPAVVAAG